MQVLVVKVNVKSRRILVMMIKRSKLTRTKVEMIQMRANMTQMTKLTLSQFDQC